MFKMPSIRMHTDAAVLQERIRPGVGLYLKAALDVVEIFIGGIATDGLPGVASRSWRRESDTPDLISCPKRGGTKLFSSGVLEGYVQSMSLKPSPYCLPDSTTIAQAFAVLHAAWARSSRGDG